jgi:hypothetical protein
MLRNQAIGAVIQHDPNEPLAHAKAAKKTKSRNGTCNGDAMKSNEGDDVLEGASARRNGAVDSALIGKLFERLSGIGGAEERERQEGCDLSPTRRLRVSIRARYGGLSAAAARARDAGARPKA